MKFKVGDILKREGSNGEIVQVVCDIVPGKYDGNDYDLKVLKAPNKSMIGRMGKQYTVYIDESYQKIGNITEDFHNQLESLVK